MKAKELIEILKKYPEDIEVKFCNNLVEDWQDIKIEKKPITLYRMDPKVKRDLINWQNESYNLGKEKETKPIKSDWEFRPKFMDQEILDEHYAKRTAIIIRTKSRGKVSYGIHSSSDIAY